MVTTSGKEDYVHASARTPAAHLLECSGSSSPTDYPIVGSSKGDYQVEQELASSSPPQRCEVPELKPLPGFAEASAGRIPGVLRKKALAVERWIVVTDQRRLARISVNLG